jgi:hypothetical protein
MGLLVLSLLLSGAVLMVLLAHGPRAGPVPQAAGAALALLPAILMSAVILAAQGKPLALGRSGADTPWRVTLAALRFPLAQKPLSIGGDADKDDLVIPGLPPGSASTLSVAEGGQDVTIRDAPPGERGGLLTVAQSGAADPFGGTLIPLGAEVCMSDDGRSCRTDAARIRWMLKGDRAVLVTGAGEACPLPPPGAARVASPVAKRVFPLATYARAGCRGRSRFQWDEGEPAEELLYWKEGSPSWLELLLFWRARVPQLHLLPVEHGRTLLILSQGRTVPVVRRPPVLHVGQEVRLSVFQIIPGTSLPSRERGDDNFARLQERRSLLLRHIAARTGPALDVFLDTPQTVALTANAHPVLTIAAQSGSPDSGAGGAQVAGFSLLGKPVAAGLLTTVRAADQVTGAPLRCRARAGALLVQGVTGISCAQLGRWFALGDPAQVLAKVRILPITVPLAWLAAIWALCLINFLVRDALGASVPARILLALTEVLLVLRLLAAFEAAAVDVRREDAVAGAWLALVWLPLALELVPASSAPALRALAARGAKLLLTVLATVLVVTSAGMSAFSARDWLAWLTGEMGKSVLVSAALALAAGWLLHGLSRARALAAVLAPRLAALLPEVPTRIPGWLRTPAAQAALPLAALVALHLVLVLSGVKEQIAGVRIAAGLIPLLVLAVPRWYGPLQEPVSWHREALLLFVPFLAYLPFVLARDTGAFIYFIALACWLSLGAWPSRPRVLGLWVAGGALVAGLTLLSLASLGAVLRPLALPGVLILVVSGAACAVLLPWHELPVLRRALASLPALAVIGMLAATQVGGHVLAQAEGSAQAKVAPAWEDVARIQELSGNAIRVLDLLAPQAVESLGVRAAYEQRVAMAEMQAYGASLAGRGWLRIPAPDALRQTHVDDTVTAVHLLGPFGRAGGLGVGLLLLAFAASLHGLAAARPAPLASRARLAATMLTVVSLYMLLANIAQVPFTGRNFYLLALASHSDLLEGGLLLIIALSAFAPSRQEGSAHA